MFHQTDCLCSLGKDKNFQCHSLSLSADRSSLPTLVDCFWRKRDLLIHLLFFCCCCCCWTRCDKNGISFNTDLVVMISVSEIGRSAQLAVQIEWTPTPTTEFAMESTTSSPYSRGTTTRSNGQHADPRSVHAPLLLRMPLLVYGTQARWTGGNPLLLLRPLLPLLLLGHALVLVVVLGPCRLRNSNWAVSVYICESRFVCICGTCFWDF